MYVIKRVWIPKPRQARLVASIVAEIGKIYVDVGQREAPIVYFNNGTLPAETDEVVMQWTSEIIDSPYREDNELPDTGEFGKKLRELTEESWIEFYELLTPSKLVPIE